MKPAAAPRWVFHESEEDRLWDASPPMPLERWAARAPRTRWPLVLLLIIALVGLAGGVTGCGGGGSEAEPCHAEMVTLPDGRVVPAPNNCPPVQP